MKKTKTAPAAFLLATLGAVLIGAVVQADDTELFVGNSAQFPAAQPNILLIVDTSDSMDTELITQAPFDPSQVYSGGCDQDRVYWRRSTGEPPDCDTQRWFSRQALVCQRARLAFMSSGRYTDRFAQFDPGTDERWESLADDQKDRFVECQDDGGRHGDGSDSAEVYAQNGAKNDLWSTDPLDQVAWGQTPADLVYTVYDANYLNWYYGPPTTSTRLQVVKEVANALLDSVSGVNVGLMRFNSGDGGSVIHAVEPIGSGRERLKAKINGLETSGLTPLSESLFEAGQYFRGGTVEFGNIANPTVSVPESRSPGNPNIYQSPLEFGCQKNFAVLLTDGKPTKDVHADDKITGLPGFGELVGPDCDSAGEEFGNGRCLDDMAEWLFETDLRPDLPGQQNVNTYTIGFNIDLPLLGSAATRGGGSYFTANNTASLSTALTNIVTSVLDTQTTFTSPSVAVNTFNRTQNLNDLFLTVFKATGRTHWPGNLKKYRLSGQRIIDSNGRPVIDPESGFLSDGSQSFWAESPDGADVTLGGAANRIPDPQTRQVYTYLGNAELTASTNAVARGNARLTGAMLGIGEPDDPNRDDLISYARGMDLRDVDQDGDLDEPRKQMGDPLHAKPVSVIYGGTPDRPKGVVYMATNDGNLHAIDSETGQEKWTFIPPEFLSDLVELYFDESTPIKHYGIDGSLGVQVKADNNGTIEPDAGERVYLFAGMRRGGAFYYGLDVSDPDRPKFMWRLDSSQLPGVGQTWAKPIATRVAVEGVSQNPDKFVLIIGGGYDPSQDNLKTSTDNQGNAIYIVDSVSGERLWYASEDDADLDIPGMTYSIPGNLKVLDLNGDRLADRIYASDMGGQVLRFDIFNGSGVPDLVTGGVFARLGAAGQGAAPQADTRRMYYPVDVALVRDDNTAFLHLGVGSGHRARPNTTVAQDRFYALRDYDVFTSKTQVAYDFFTPIQDSDLVDITDDIAADVPLGSAGWKLELRTSGWRGEKVLAEARTFDNKVFLTTFTPGVGASINDCEPALGLNRLYVLDIYNGAPVNNLDGRGDEDALTLEDRFTESSGSIASEVVFLFPSPEDPSTCVGDECRPEPLACVDLFCFPPGFNNDPVRTTWSQESMDY